MGKVTARVKLTNQGDLVLQQRGLATCAPREIEVETLVDTGATRLYLKPSVIQRLGLLKVDEVVTRTTNGDRTRNVFEPVRLELMQRSGNFDVVDIDEHLPNLLGQIPLEYLDLVVDPKAREVRPNPEHGDKFMTEEF